MSILETICGRRRESVRALRSRHPYSALESSALYGEARRPFVEALRRPDGDPAVRFLAEIKRASPSAGPIRPGADPVAIAREYAEAGAAAISVLTEPEFFDGDPAFLARVRGEVPQPLLMKDFIVDPWQVVWGRSLGADAVLLIVAALDPRLFDELAAAAREVGLAVLVEVHDEAELERALASGAPAIGVNHRDLKSFTIDLALSERMLPRMPQGIVRVAESGIRDRSDVLRLEAAGFDALLVGERLMRDASPGAALRRLKGDEQGA